MEDDYELQGHPPKPKKPKYQNKYWVIPIELVMVYEILHDITSDEFLMLARIEGLVRFGKQSKCFATNKWFADRHGCSERRVQQILKSLKDKNFIAIRVSKLGKRTIRTKWSPKEIVAKIHSQKKKSHAK